MATIAALSLMVASNAALAAIGSPVITDTRVRRWDGYVEASPTAPASSGGWDPLESGVETKLTPGTYRIGDDWMIPARTAIADVEWPQSGNAPAFVSPQGVLRAFMQLGILVFSAGAWVMEYDGRPLFPSLRELTSLCRR